MKVILLGELRGKGGEGDVVDVAQGYAENYLFRNKIAQPATPCNLKQLEQRRDSIAKREAERISNAEATKAVLDEKLVKVDAKIGEEGQLFGSVTSQQIVEAIKAQLGVDVDRKRIVRGATIKTAGRHAVEINLYRDINAKVVVLVGDEPVAEEPAAEEAAEPEATEAADEAAETTEAAEQPSEFSTKPASNWGFQQFPQVRGGCYQTRLASALPQICPACTCGMRGKRSKNAFYGPNYLGKRASSG